MTRNVSPIPHLNPPDLHLLSQNLPAVKFIPQRSLLSSASEDKMNRSEPDRLRPAPRERFANDILHFDLDWAFDKLANEPHPSVDGHRQITLFKDGPFTVIALLFRQGGFLPRHNADGIVTLQLLDGRLDVHTDHGRYALGDRGFLVIQPTTHFAAYAPTQTRLIMTVHLINND